MIKAYAALAPGKALEAFEYDPGPLKSDQVNIKVDHCGICHSDLSMIDNEWGMSAYPLVAGHEVIGTITDLGDQVTHLEKGQRIGLGWHKGYCGHCSPCQQGDQNLCGSAAQTIVGHHGGFADQVRAQATSVIPLPSELNLEKAGPLFCGGITVFNPLVQFNIRPTDKVAVIGIGGLGHLALQFYRAWGCEVTAFTSNPSKEGEAKALGAHKTLNTKNPKELEQHAGYFDFIISTVNVKLDWNAYLMALKPKGRFHIVGLTLEPLDIQALHLIAAQRSVSGTPVGSPSTIATMLEFAARHKIEAQTEHFKFSEINKALEHLREGKARYRVVLSQD